MTEGECVQCVPVPKDAHAVLELHVLQLGLGCLLCRGGTWRKLVIGVPGQPSGTLPKRPKANDRTRKTAGKMWNISEAAVPRTVRQ